MCKRFQIKSERGQALVEFAVVVPVLLMLLLGIMQFGVAFNNYLTLTDAVRVGSRVAVVSRFEPCPSCEAEDAVRDAAHGLDQAELDIQVSSTWQPGEQVTITATYPYRINILGKVVASGRLTSELKERVE